MPSLAQASHRSFPFNSAQIGAFDLPRVGIRRALGYFRGVFMPSFELPRAAVAVELPRHVRLQIVSPAAEPPSRRPATAGCTRLSTTGTAWLLSPLVRH